MVSLTKISEHVEVEIGTEKVSDFSHFYQLWSQTGMHDHFVQEWKFACLLCVVSCVGFIV